MKKVIVVVAATLALTLSAYAAEQRTVFKLGWGKSVTAVAKSDYLEVTTPSNVVRVYYGGRVMVE